MNFQYFFFNTYPGYFLQMVPFAAAAGVGVGLWKRRRGAGQGRSVFAGLLAAYLTGLVGVTLLLRPINLLWYWLIYGQSGGRMWFFTWTYDFVPDFWNHFRGENLANALMFVPFGLLGAAWLPERRIWMAAAGGIVASCLIESAQALLLPNRFATIYDVTANSLGAALGCILVYAWHSRRTPPS